MASSPRPVPSRARGGSTGITSPLVGREAELLFLGERLAEAASGQGGCVLLSGAPGVGKSRILAELAEGARRDGWLVLPGRAYDTAGMPPYFPFAEALSAFVKTSNLADLERLLGDSKQDMTLILPDLQERFGSVIVPGDQNSEADRYRLFERASSFLTALANDSESAGVLLCLDDLHWADESTLLLLHHLLRRLSGARLLVAGAFRTEDVDRERTFFNLLADLARENLAARVPVQPFSRDEAAEYLRAAGAAVATNDVDVIYRQTEGNPFYLGELLRHLQREGLIGSDLAGTDWAIPESIRQVIGKRLLRLTPETLGLLQAGAVLGDGFQFEMAAAISDVDEQALMDALDQAIDAGLLVEAGDICRFGHPLIQRTLYDGLNSARRRSLHLRAAQAIESRYERHIEPHLSPLALNYRLAGERAEPEKPIEFSAKAGAAAEKALAYEEASVHWQAALNLMERHSFEPGRQAEIHARMGYLMQVIGFDRYADGVHHFKQAVALYDQAGATVEAASVRARLGALLGAGGLSPVNDNEAALRYLEEAEGTLGRNPPGEAQLSLYTGLDVVLVWQVRPEEGLAVSEKAMALATELGRFDVWCRNAAMRGSHLLALGRIAEGIEVMGHAADKADEIDQTLAAYVAIAWLGNRFRDLRDPARGATLYESEVSKRRQVEAPTRRRSLWSELATMKAMSGELGESRRILEEQGIAGDPYTAFWLGDWGAAESQWAARRDRALAGHHFYDLVHACFSLADIARLQGDTRRAIDLYNEGVAVGVSGPHAVFRLWGDSELAIIHASQGRLAEAADHLERCRATIAQKENWGGLGCRVELAEAAFSFATDDIPAADGHFIEALVTARRYQLPWDEADIHATRGLILGRAGVHYKVRASESFEEALTVYQRIGAAPAWADSLSLRRAMIASGSAPRQDAVYPNGLTDREVEVLRLLAGGQSNREIAAELVVSVRTVERHITNIYGKIGARGRADATVFALHHLP